MTKRRLHAEPRRFWSAAETRELRRRYPHEPTADIARALGRTLTATYAQAKKIGVEKSAAYLESPAACRLRRGEGPDHPGAKTQFKPGQEPANKGLRRPGWYAGRMRETQFKPGQKGTRFMPVGSTRVADGYVWRKVSDIPKVCWLRNWVMEHRLVWIAAHGPIPPGHLIVFRDKNPMHVALENLECITRGELAQRNRMWNTLPRPLAETIHLLGQLKRRIRQHEGLHHATRHPAAAVAPVRHARRPSR